MAGLPAWSMTDVVAAARSKFYKNWSETQLQRAYRIYRDVMKFAQEEENNHKYEWTIRTKSATGASGFYNSFQSVSGVRDTYTASLNVQPRTVMTHKNMVFDILQLNKNKGQEGKLWDIMKNALSAAEEDKAETFEYLFSVAPYNVSDDDGWLGWMYWFARSQTSGGTFTEQLDPARNGVYRTLRNSTTPTATLAGQDTSTADNARLRTLVCTHRGTIDDTTLKSLDRCVRDAEFEMLDNLQGDKPSGQYMIYWKDDFDSQYNDLLSAAGGPKTRDWRNSGQKFVSGVPTRAVPSWQNLSGVNFPAPIIGINHSNLHFVKARGEWEMDLEKDTDSPTAKMYPRIHTGQFKCKDPRTAGFLCHGSW